MKVRVKFTKTGVLKYIGHLDLMRYFQKALRRTDINVLYSKGFSPHMIMSFAQPLGVGIESLGEYFDIEVDDSEDVSTMRDRLNETQVEGITIERCFILPDDAINAMASIKAADYEIDFYELKPDLDELINLYNSKSVMTYVKTTKSGESEINIKEFVYDIHKDKDNLYIRVNASSSGNLKPTVFLECLMKEAGLLLSNYKFHITRLDLLTTNKEENFISLGKIDE